jgi:uroporphyrinogen-III synthase
MTARPLTGKAILVTRPADQASGLATRIEQLGGAAILFPCLVIAAPADTQALAHAIGELRRYDRIVFISPTAVERAWPFILARHGDWPSGFDLAAVGRGTARVLAGFGARDVLLPEAGADSEHLLALEAMRQVAGKRILIVRGEGGRERLAEALRERGASVDYAEAYRRVRPEVDPAPLLELWRKGGVRAVTVTSREILANLFDLLGPVGTGLIETTPMFAIHQRIADEARARGVRTVVVTPPGEDGLVSALQDWFNGRHG